MRIISGSLKGRTLYGFRGEEIRPTSDNARESLFNILGDVAGAGFLDLFSGTGAVGIEALSRGAEVVFNDGSKESADLTRANLKKVGVSAEVYCQDAIKFIQSSRKKFDIIFLDPPYKSDIISELLNNINSLLKDGGKVIFENENPFTGIAAGLVLTDVRKYGRAFLNFFEKKQAGFAVYAGTFDPVTVGHEQSVLSALSAFNKVFVVVGENAKKEPVFSEEERTELVRATFNGKNVEVVRYSDFAGETEYAEFLKKSGVTYYVRGIRSEEDFAYEKKAERRNSAVYPFIKTAYIFCEEKFKAVSSTKVKTLIKKGADASEFIPEGARKLFAEIMRKKGRKE